MKRTFGEMNRIEVLDFGVDINAPTPYTLNCTTYYLQGQGSRNRIRRTCPRILLLIEREREMSIKVN